MICMRDASWEEEAVRRWSRKARSQHLEERALMEFPASCSTLKPTEDGVWTNKVSIQISRRKDFWRTEFLTQFLSSERSRCCTDC